MPRAICVVGGDKRSSIWIKKNRSKLESINALCIVVNVSSKSRFRSIKSLAPSLSPPTTQIALGILFLIFLPLTLPMLNIDETTGKRLIDFFIYRGIFFIFTLGF
jgi:hypothetical protein